MLTKPGKGDPAPLGNLRQRKFSCAKQFDGCGVLLPAPRTNAPLLVVRKTQPPTLQLPAFEKPRTVRTKLIAQTRRVQSEQVRDLLYVVFEILCIAAGRDRVAVLGTGRRGLAPTSPQARTRGVRHRRNRYAVARQQQVAAVLVQIAPEPRIRYTATAQIARTLSTVEPYSPTASRYFSAVRGSASPVPVLFSGSSAKRFIDRPWLGFIQ